MNTKKTPNTGATTIPSSVGNEQLAQQIVEVEAHLIKLRAARDERILASYDEGLSKYRLAKDWGVNENTITRIVSRRRAGQ